MKIIPAIDIMGGKCVRLSKGDFNKSKMYSENPVEVAKRFEGAGYQYLHLVDLDGARFRKITNWKTIIDVTKQTSLKIDFGGGINSADDATRLFDAGVCQINVGSLASKNPSLLLSWINTFGPEKIILSADVKDELVLTHGWLKHTGQPVIDFIKKFEKIRYITCTDVSKDGMLKGPNFNLMRKLVDQFPDKYFIASGGIRSVEDVHILKDMGVNGAIIGKAFYEEKILLNAFHVD